MTDIFQEIDESVREERFLNLWKKYSLHVYVAVTVILVSAAGYIFYTHHQATRNAELSLAYMAVVEELRTATTPGEIDAAEASAEAFVKTSGHSGYGALARLHEATFLLKQNAPEKAVQVLAQLAEERGAPDTVRALARIRWGYVAIAHTPSEALMKTVLKEMQPFTKNTSPWRLAALEITGYAALNLQDVSSAKRAFEEMLETAIAGHRELPAMRARIMLDHLATQIPAPAAATQASAEPQK